MRVALVLLCVCRYTSGYSMEDTCHHWSGTGYIGDAKDCQSWGYCQDNRLISRGRCDSGLLYDFRDGNCRKAINVDCFPVQTEICALRQPADYAADPVNCSIYRKCDSDWDDKRMQLHCSAGQVFSNRLQRCVSQVDGCPQHTRCSTLKNGSLLRESQDCREYWLCQNGLATKQRCSAGRYFNSQSERCQSAPTANCVLADEDLNSPPLTDAYICAKYYQDDRSGVQFISDALTCHGYYLCSSQFAIGKWQSCPLGTHFQWWSQRCALPETYSCPYDRCGNLDAALVTTIETGCQGYTVCHNQRSLRVENCPADYPYFNENSGLCGQEFPKHAVCFMDG